MLSTFGVQVVLVDVTVGSLPVESPSGSLANVWGDSRINDSRTLSCKLAADFGRNFFVQFGNVRQVLQNLLDSLKAIKLFLAASSAEA